MQDFHAQVAYKMSVARGDRLELSCDDFRLDAEGILPIEDGGRFVMDLAIDLQYLQVQLFPRLFFMLALSECDWPTANKKMLVHHKSELGGESI